MKELQMMEEDHVARDCFLILKFHLYSLNTNKITKISASQKAYIINDVINKYQNDNITSQRTSHFSSIHENWDLPKKWNYSNLLF